MGREGCFRCAIVNLRKNTPHILTHFGYEGYDVRVVNNMGVEVATGEQGNLAVKVKPHFPPGLFRGKQIRYPKG